MMKIDKLYSIVLEDVDTHWVEDELRALLTYDQALALRDALNNALGLDQGRLFDDVPAAKPPMKAPPVMFGGMKVGEASKEAMKPEVTTPVNSSVVHVREGNYKVPHNLPSPLVHGDIEDRIINLRERHKDQPLSERVMKLYRGLSETRYWGMSADELRAKLTEMGLLEVDCS